MSEDLDIKFDKEKALKFVKKYKVVLLLLIPLFLAIFFRAYPYTLPITDDFAQNNIENNVRTQVQAQLLNSYPDLSQEDLAQLTEQQYQSYYSENKQQIEEFKKTLSAQLKENFKNEKGQTYLLAIDPYVYFLEARNELGDKEKDFEINEYYDSVYSMLPRFLHPNLMVFSYKILNPIFGTDLHDISFALPMIIAALSIIPAFFITRRISGNVGGLFGASILAVSSSFLSRTPAGFSDTDAYNILFPLLIIWPLMESFIAKTKKRKIFLASLSGILTGIYSFVWIGWWYIFDFIIGTLGIYFIFLLIKNRKNIKGIFKNKQFKVFLNNSIAYFVSSGIIVTILNSFKTFIYAPLNPLEFSSIQEAAKQNTWPNVYTTVAELNPASLDSIINSVGGSLFFYISILGIILTLFFWRKKTLGVLYSTLLAVWFVGTIYAATKGVRFILNFSPAFSIAAGAALGLTYYGLSNWSSKNLEISKKLVKISLLILFVILMINPIKEAHSIALNEVPSYNDNWNGVLTKIKEETSKETIIASWWDFGWWFMSMGERQVIFNGGSQNQPQAHWIGKALSTDNEKQSVGILRMLVCGRNTAFDIVDEKFQNSPKSMSLIYEIIELDKSQARSKLVSEGFENPEEILEVTHCESPPEVVLITSEDMVSKAGVWSHFGLWDFEKAYTYNNIKNLNKENAVSLLVKNLEITEETASNYYNEVQLLRTEREINSWISPYPGYSNFGNCFEVEQGTVCTNGVNIVNNTVFLSTNNGNIKPNVFNNNGDINFYEDGTEELAIAYNKETQTSFLTDENLINSIFTKLFFFNGKNTENFELFDTRESNNFKISTWTVNFNN